MPAPNGVIPQSPADITAIDDWFLEHQLSDGGTAANSVAARLQREEAHSGGRRPQFVCTPGILVALGGRAQPHIRIRKGPGALRDPSGQHARRRSRQRRAVAAKVEQRFLHRALHPPAPAADWGAWSRSGRCAAA